MNACDQLPLFHAPSIAPDNLAMYTNCNDCDARVMEIGESYMVRGEVWPIHPDGGRLCIRCLEARIGRRLTPEDFTDCPANGTRMGKSARLRARLTGGQALSRMGARL
jgi:hypothetical protein